MTAFVLAGGKSTRMGRDKALLELEGETLLERALKRAGAVTPRTFIVGGAGKFANFGDVVEDVYPERGPLGAIHAALECSQTEWNLMLAVDMPFMKEEFLRWMTAVARWGNATVTVPQVGGKLQPLCGVYRKAFAGVAQRSLERGENKIDRLFSEVTTRVIEESDLKSAGFFRDLFRNVNTQEEWEAAIRSERERVSQ